MKRITIVEDERLMREELSEMLQKAGYQVWEVREFTEVPAQLSALSVDLVLLDLNLPGASGFDICRQIKQISAVPVLVLTSGDQMRGEIARDLGLRLEADSRWGEGVEMRILFPAVKMG